jgi:hypothetical protein
MIHVTCTAHGQHRVAETVRSCYPNVDGLVANGKKIFRKCPSRVQIFEDAADLEGREIPLPPKPCTTRWGTWLEAVRYYNNYLPFFAEVVIQLDETDFVAIKACQTLLEKYDDLEADVTYLDANFVRLKFAIKTLEKDGLPLADALKCIDDVTDDLPFGSLGSKAAKINTKMTSILEKNKGLHTLRAISTALTAERTEDRVAARRLIKERLTSEDLTYYKFAPTTSCSVERSFSVYKTLNCSNRQSFEFQNMRKVFVSRCNAQTIFALSHTV